MTYTKTKNRIPSRMKRAIGICAFHSILLFLCQPSRHRLSLFFVQSQQQSTVISNYNESRSRNLQKAEKEGAWIITQNVNKNNFILGYVPEGPTMEVIDYDPDEDIRVITTYNGTIYLNAWIPNDEFDIAPKYVERYSGIKYASVYKRFKHSKQAYGYTFVDYNVSKDDENTREIFVNATKFSPACIQDGIDLRFMNEDCLYLNIWRPSKWKQTVNTTTRCKQKFLGGGLYRKDCDVVTTTKTINTDGSVVKEINTKKSSKTIPIGGLYGNQYGRMLNLKDTLGNLDQALNDLNDLIEDEKNDSEDEKKPNIGVTNSGGQAGDLGTYSVDSSGLLPVIVYIHGGGFMKGSGSDELFDGSKVVARGQVILITFNYRLGIFGFLPSFGWDQWKVNGGMNGFMDIVQALIWVNRNIIKWGGDPNRVTILGPSSTPAVCLLTMCPMAAGTFQRAILTTSVRETEVRNGTLVTENGVNGASCLLSSQEPYQQLEGRIEIAYKFFDYINETLYDFPENPNPTYEDLTDWLRAFALTSPELWEVAKDEGTIFVPSRPAASYDYNRDENITDTQQRRTFLTWDNDAFPQMPIDLENMNPVDMIVGVRGRSTVERKIKKTKSTSKLPSKNKKPNKRPSKNDNEEASPAPLDLNVGNAFEKQTATTKSNNHNIFLRNADDSLRHLEEGVEANEDEDEEEGNNGASDNDYDDDESYETICSNYSQYDDEESYGNQTSGNFTTSNETECEEEEHDFNFGGTTNDQDLCVSKQFAQISARNVQGNVYGYVLDDGSDLHGYQDNRFRRTLQEEVRTKLREKQWEDPPERTRRLQQIEDVDYDIESLYFFDNLWKLGIYLGEDEVRVQNELFNRWINFAKTGVPKVSKRSVAESKKYTTWEPFPKSAIGGNTNDDSLMPSYLYLTSDHKNKEEGDNSKRSTMLRVDELLSHRTLQSYDSGDGFDDICSWVLDDENDLDGDFVEVLLDFDANTAFEYYITILATLNPTINYLPEREYVVKMPPTQTPTSIQEFIEKSIEIHSSSPPHRIWMGNSLTSVLLGTLTVLVGGFVAFG